LDLIEKKELNEKYVEEKETANYLNYNSKISKTKNDFVETRSKIEKTNKYSELEKCALKILNDFD